MARKALAALAFAALATIAGTATATAAPVANKNCNHLTLHRGQHGRCVSDLQWLLRDERPAVRPVTKACGGCANHDARYWRIRKEKVNGLFQLGTAKQVRLAKHRLGYPTDGENGLAGPKLRAYLLGKQKLPKDYRHRMELRHAAWHHANAPSRQPKPAGPTTASGRTVNKDCPRKTLKHNDRGRCVRSIQWLLTGQDPAWRPKYAKEKHQAGANVSTRYWRIRPGDPSGVYGTATIHEVQRAKFRLGFPPGQANGAAGPKFRAYLLGRPLPTSYVNAKENRYQAWRKEQSGPNAGVKKLITLAYRAIELHDHFYYTQTSHRSDFLSGLDGPYPKGGDCSGSVAALYHLAFGGRIQTGSYSPWDWTGSMQDRGRVVWRAGQSLTRLHLGDLVFYGYGSPYTHVAMEIAPGRVYSFGSNGCPCNNSTLYRDDARIARRYVPDSWTR